MSTRIKLGDQVKDSITGHEGIAVTASMWLHGCRRITFQAPCGKDGKHPETWTVDEPQLTVSKAGVVESNTVPPQTSIKLGDRVKDRITGYAGIMIGDAQHLQGCRRIAIQPEKVGEDGKIPDAFWFDEGTVLLVKEAVVPSSNREPDAALSGKATGGPSERVSLSRATR